ncbi:hypothetical protein SCUP234_04259 [Seiridium cupressi]
MDLLNKTFTVHCMSVVVEPQPPSILSQRLRDFLVGDTVRGVEIPGDDTPGDAGTLASVDWQVEHDDPGTTHRVELVYERSTFIAYLLLSRGMLLTYAPAPIRNAIIQFLSRTFDTRISVLIPNSATLIRIFENWLEDGVRTTKKDVVITLGFSDKAVSGGLRSLDVTIPADDLAGFVGTDDGGRFSDKLAAYMHRHLALNIQHPEVRVGKISCGGFMLGEGKLKVLDEATAAVVLGGIK